jgi:monoterpene epsilon-lactone hydrolase
MASIRAHLINVLMRFATKRRLKRALTPLEARAIMDQARSRPAKGVLYAPAALAGVPGEWATAEQGAPFGTLLYLHGGAYIGMSARTHRSITGFFAQQGLRVFAADYRLAPEHPFPAALDDAMAAFDALCGESPGPLFVAGDSAGGGLTLALLLRCRDEGRRLSQGAVLFSPWADLAGTGESMVFNRERDPLLSADGVPNLGTIYAGATDVRMPYVSPLYGDFTGLPPLKIFVGDREILLDDSRRVAERARAAGVEVDLEIWPVVPHVWQIMPAILPEARVSLARAAAFIRAHAGGG